MSKRLQIRRGSGNPGNIFYEGEPIFDKVNKVLYFGDSGSSGTGAGTSLASAESYSAILEFLSSASATSSGSVRFYEDTDNGINYVELKAPSSVGVNTVFILPVSDGTPNQILKTDGQGQLGFVTVTESVVTDLQNYLTDIVNDTTPQLGGDLDLNGNNITGTGNLNVTGIVTATSFVKSSGTSTEFLKADGSVDNNTYLTSSGDASNLTNLTGASAATYGDANFTPVIVVDANGRITGITTVATSGSGGGGGGISTDTQLFDGLDSTSFLRSDDGDRKTFGDLTFEDNVKLNLGSGGQHDSSIYHSGTDATFVSRNGDIVLQTIDTGEGGLGDDIIIKAGTGKTSIFAHNNGAVELYHNNSKKFETTSTGITVTGAIVKSGGTSAQFLKADGSVDSSTYITSADGGDAATLDGVDSASFLRSDAADTKTSGNLTFNDNIYARFGTSGEMTIVNDGTDNHIRSAFDEDLNIELSPDGGTPKIYIRPTTSHQGITLGGGSGNPVELYHNNAKKFETTGIGVSIVGTGNTATITGPSNLVLDPGTVGDNTGTVTVLGNLQVDGTQTVINSTTMTVDDLNITLASGAANAAAANGAGLTIDGASATFNYASSGDKWIANKSIEATSFIKNGGASSEFLKADGSVDTSTYLTSYTETDPVVAAINGIVKSNGTTIAAAVAGTDYLTPSGDGSSLSNVDATTLDSIDSGSFLRSDVGDTKTSGDLTFNDNVKINLGSSGQQDSSIYYDGTDTIFNSRNGDIVLQTIDTGEGGSGDDIIIKAGTGKTSIFAHNNGAVELWNDGSKKFETTGVGVTVTGDLIVSNNARITGILTVGSSSITLDGSDNSIHGFDTLIAPPKRADTVNISVTVGSKTTANRYYDQGAGNSYFLNGVEAPFLTLTPGRTYRFTLSSSDMTNHPFRLYLEADKTTAYTTNVTSTATYTEIVVNDATPSVLHYQCSAHSLMGNSVQTNSSVPVGSGANLTGVLSDVVEDTTPQLGGNLDLNSNNINGTGDIDVTGYFSVTSTDAGNGSGPYIDLYRNSASPAASDNLGIIRFWGENDADEKKSYSYIISKILDPTDGSEDGRMDFVVMGDGSASTRMVLQGTGATKFVNQDILLGQSVDLIFEGATNNTNETTLTVTDPTQDNTITLPDATGTVLLTDGSASSLTGLTGASAATYGNSTTTPVITVDANGRITTISTATISGGGGGGSSLWTSTGYTGIGTASAVGIGTIIEIIPYDTQNSGTLSFEASAGQLFSITNNLSSGSIFSVNDISGIPSIDVDADGTILFAPYSTTEKVGIGTTNPSYKMDVVGDINFTGTLYQNGSVFSSGSGGISNVVEDTTPQLGGNLDLNSKNITGTGDVNVTGIVTVTSTDAGSGAGPFIDLYRNSASPSNNDTLGKIRFYGENDNDEKILYSSIYAYAADETDGTEDARLYLDVISAGSDSNRIMLQGGGNTKFMNKNVTLDTGVDLVFEGASSNSNETTLTVTNPTQDNTITLPDATGTVLLTDGSAASLTSLTGASSGTYGDATNSAQITVDANGRITGISEVSISGGGGGSGSTTRSVNRYVATNNQTLFPPSGTVSYAVGYIDVYLNGSKLDTTEFTASNGTTVTLTTGASTNDIVELVAYNSINVTNVTVVNDTSPQLGGDLDLNGNDITGTGNINVTGTATVTGGQVATQNDAIAFAIALG